MHAVVYRNAGEIRVEDVPDLRIEQPTDAVVRATMALTRAADAAAKAGTVGIISVYPPTSQSFPIGMAMNKNLTIKGGNCNHRRYLPKLIDIVASGRMSLAPNLTQSFAFDDVAAGYESFDRREEHWVKVALATT